MSIETGYDRGESASVEPAANKYANFDGAVTESDFIEQLNQRARSSDSESEIEKLLGTANVSGDGQIVETRDPNELEPASRINPRAINPGWMLLKTGLSDPYSLKESTTFIPHGTRVDLSTGLAESQLTFSQRKNPLSQPGAEALQNVLNNNKVGAAITDTKQLDEVLGELNNRQAFNIERLEIASVGGEKALLVTGAWHNGRKHHGVIFPKLHHNPQTPAGETWRRFSDVDQVYFEGTPDRENYAKHETQALRAIESISFGPNPHLKTNTSDR